jgi:PAS domain S-box-containing protein
MKHGGLFARPVSRWWLNPPAPLRYAISAALIGAAVAVNMLIEKRFVGAPALLLLCAVMLSAWFGGFRAGLSATALAILAFVYFFVPPGHTLMMNLEQAPRVAIFSVLVLFVALLTATQRRVAEVLRRARDQLHDANQRLQSTNMTLQTENADRRRTEEALRQSEQRFRDYAETSSDWLWETGPDHRFVAISEQLHAIAISSTPRIGQRRWEFAADVAENLEKWRAHITAHEAHLPFHDFIYKLFRDDGSPAHVKTSGRPFFDSQNRFLGYRGVATDITAEIQRREAENALRQARAELAHVTRVTTLGELTASIVHEVNQPLAAIATTGEACLRLLDCDGPDLTTVREAISGMIGDTRRAGEVIRRIRTLTLKAEPQMVPLDINVLVDEVVQLIQREVIDHGVSIHRDLAPTIAQVLGDRVGLQQVIINLVMNGMEAMADVADRPRNLVIRSRQDIDRVVVAVEDSGVGLQQENSDRLFDSFYTTKPGGLGMGLSICRSIVESHGGRLSASRNIGPGATFQLFLPLSRESTMAGR